MKTSIQSTLIIKSKRKDEKTKTPEIAFKISKNDYAEKNLILNKVNEITFNELKFDLFFEYEVFFCITLAGAITKQESRKWEVENNKISSVVDECFNIFREFKTTEQKQLEQQLDEELNLCHDEKPSVLGDSLFDDEDEKIEVFIEEDAIQEKINTANADEIEEDYSKEEEPLLDKTLDCSDELTLDDEDDQPQPTTLEQTCKAIALVSLSTMLLSGAVVMAVHAIHQVKTLF